MRRFGGSNKGEEWDYVEHMDTYYNPTPHFGFDNAVRHSPNLFHLPVRSRDSEHSAGLGLEGGIDDL